MMKVVTMRTTTMKFLKLTQINLTPWNEQKVFHKPSSVFEHTWANQTIQPVNIRCSVLLCLLPCEICCTVHVWSCSVLDHAKIFLTSKLSYLLFFFPAPPHKTKTGIAMRWETTNNNSLGPIRLCGQWTGGVGFAWQLRNLCMLLPASMNWNLLFDF
jgi:hypothetical protein